MPTFKYPICRVVAYALFSEMAYEEIPEEQLNQQLIQYAKETASDWDEGVVPQDELWIDIEGITNVIDSTSPAENPYDKAMQTKTEEWNKLPPVCKLRDVDFEDDIDNECRETIHQFMLSHDWFKVDNEEDIYARKK